MISLALALLLGAGCVSHRDPDDDKASGEPIGVAECDEYVARYEGCLEKMPGAAGEVPRQALRAQRESFRATARSPAGKTGLKKTCRQLMEGLAQNAVCR